MIDRVIAAPDSRCDGVCYDGAFGGTHIDHCMKRGLTVLSPVHDGTAKPARAGPDRLPGGDTHDLWPEAGRICERQILGAGREHLQACPTDNPTDKGCSRRNADGSHRWYLEFAAPSCGSVHRERTDTTADDRARGHNRAEHSCQHVKADTSDSVYDRWLARTCRKPQQHPRPHPLRRPHDRRHRTAPDHRDTRICPGPQRNRSLPTPKAAPSRAGRLRPASTTKRLTQAHRARPAVAWQSSCQLNSHLPDPDRPGRVSTRRERYQDAKNTAHGTNRRGFSQVFEDVPGPRSSGDRARLS